jgi:nitric oxide reductase large subunit
LLQVFIKSKVFLVEFFLGGSFKYRINRLQIGIIWLLLLFVSFHFFLLPYCSS